MGLGLHPKRTDLHHSKIVDYFDACVAALAETAGYQLPSMTVYNVLAFFYGEFSQ
jgi:hypothetical protein